MNEEEDAYKIESKRREDRDNSRVRSMTFEINERENDIKEFGLYMSAKDIKKIRKEISKLKSRVKEIKRKYEEQ